MAVAGLIACSAMGCQGRLDAEATANSTPNKPGANGGTLVVDGEEIPVELTRAHLRRLTAIQFENTVRYALGDVVQNEDLPTFGDDIPTIGLNNNPSLLRINAVNVDSLYNATQALAQASVQNTPSVRDCVAAADDACFENLVDELGHKLWRRPLTAEEKADLLQTRASMANVATRAEQAEFILMALIASPNTLYRREIGQPQGDATELDDFELASALSFTLWNAPPDEVLYQAAVAGELKSKDALVTHAKRMMEDPRAADAFAEFFIDYLKIDGIFAKSKLASLGLTPEARASLVQGIRQDLREIFASPDASLLDPFTTTSFHVDANGASFFGVPVVQDQGFEVVAMDPSQRLGVLSHPAFLSVHAGEGDSGIVKRGVFTLEQLLCVPLGAPPANIAGRDDVPADFDDSKETSRAVLTVRHSSQSACVGCHQVIDPAGFGFENYDSAGRYREVEKGNVAIDASGELKLGLETLSYVNSVGYIDALQKSEALRSCLSNTLFTYVMGDKPRLAEREALYQTFDQSNGRVDALVEALVTTPSFSARTPSEQ
ncbi:MAG: DUF1588 domain-containing protein [bacterium]